MKIRPLGAEVVHADGWTQKRTCKTQLIVAFRNFANAPKNCVISGFRSDVAENLALLGYYAASSGNFLPRNYHYSLRNNPG
jgi:hypothetical protein